MKKPAQPEATPSQPIPSVYDQVAYTNQLSTHVTETETDILSPGFQFSSIQPGIAAKTFVENDGAQVHRIDPQHDIQSPHSTRLQKFIELSQQYANSDAQVIAPATESEPQDSITFRATADWKTETKHKFVGQTIQPTKKPHTPVSKPSRESTLDSKSVKIRIDSGTAQTAPHFEVEAPPAAPIPSSHISAPQNEVAHKASSDVPWKVASLVWPAITDRLLHDPALIIDRIGDNISKLMTGDQNQLMVASPSRGEGVTTLSISIARWARNHRRQVLLIDADLRNAGLTASVGLGQEVSWLNAVNNPQSVGDTIVQDQNTGLFLMPLAPMTDRSNLPSNIYEALGKMLEPISDCFELIVMDIGPSHQFLNEASRVDFVADMALLVKDVTKTDSGKFATAKSNLLSAGICKMIVAENFTGGTQSV